VARTIVDGAFADQLRGACLAAALDLGGWYKKSKSPGGKSKRPPLRHVAAS